MSAMYGLDQRSGLDVMAARLSLLATTGGWRMSFRWLPVLLLIALACPARAATGYEAEVYLAISDETATMEYELDQAEARDLESSPARLEELMERAKSDYADTHGYSKKQHGKENWKLMSGLRVDKVTLKTPHGTKE